MAAAADILFVQDNLPNEASSLGWDETKITAELDAGNSAVQTVRNFWSYRASSTNEFTDISESGSSRSLESVWQHAMKMLQYWDGRVQQEKDEDGDVNPRGRISFHTATRV